MIICTLFLHVYVYVKQALKSPKESCDYLISDYLNQVCLPKDTVCSVRAGLTPASAQH